jgi:signal transduction histidine kinase
MLGAAIFVAYALLMVSIGQLAVTRWAVPAGLAIPILVTPLFLLGLLPGLREVEVTAARSLLGVTAELVTPARPHAEHRIRTTVWVSLHLLIGGAMGLATVFGVATVGGSWGSESSLGAITPILAGFLPGGARGRVVELVLGLTLLVLVGAAVWLTGRLMASWAPTFLGPTWRDRLELAQLRLQAETEHRRLARELHDGVGHALSSISLQAVAGRRVIETDADRAGEALETIESTARLALEGLDDMVGVLRDGVAASAPEPGIAELDALLEAHRRVGMELSASIDRALVEREPALSGLLATTVFRIASEGLTNASRYAVRTPVRLAVTLEEPDVIIEVRNALPGRGASRRRSGRTLGHGLTGISERVALFGGQVTAGVDKGDWLLRATLPIGRSRG